LGAALRSLKDRAKERGPMKKKTQRRRWYRVLVAEDVPCYGYVEIQATGVEDAISVVKAFKNLGDFTHDIAWEYATCKRIVHIEDQRGEIVVENVELD
jgi:hypothetical protein